MYTCPMHPEIKEKKPGSCPLCGMALVKKGSGVSTEHHALDEKGLVAYKPLIVIIGLIILVTVALAYRDITAGDFSWTQAMSYFMSGFFLVFSGFKLLDLKGFAQGYSTYDLLAKKIYSYGYVYPFIELFLGLSYAVSWQIGAINIITLIVMGFSGLGVLQSMLKKRAIQCACLGTIFKLPLTKVTLIEDFGMAAMAALMLLW